MKSGVISFSFSMNCRARPPEACHAIWWRRAVNIFFLLGVGEKLREMVACRRVRGEGRGGETGEGLD